MDDEIQDQPVDILEEQAAAAADALIAKTEARFIQQVRDDYALSQEALRTKHNKFITYLKRYYNEDNTKRPKGMARSTVPLIKEAVDVTVASIINAEFQTELNIDTRGREPNDEPAAAANRDMIKYQADYGKVKGKLAEVAFSMVLYGMGPAKVYYNEQYSKSAMWVDEYDPTTGVPSKRQVEREFLRYKGGVLEPIDILDWFPHPDKKTIYDHLSTIQRFYPSAVELIDRRDKGIYNNVDTVLAAIEDGALQHDTTGMQLKEQRHQITGQTFNSKMFANTPECLEWQGYFDLNGDGEPVLTIGVLAHVDSGKDDRNDEYVVLRLQKLEYKNEEPTYICGRFFRVPAEFWAIGVGEMLESDEETATALLRMQIDACHRIASPRTYVMLNSLVDEKELELPWGVVHINENELGTGAVREEQAGMIGQDGYTLFQAIQTSAKARVPSVDAMMAGRSAGSPNTATVGSYVYQQASARFKHMLWMFEESVIIPMCEKFHAINQQFIDRDYAIWILGEAGGAWSLVTPQQIAANINFIAIGSSKEADRQINIEQLMRYLQVVSSNPLGQAVFPILAVNLAEEFKLRNLSNIKAALGYEQILAQLQQAKQMGVTPQQLMIASGQLMQQQYPNQNQNPRNTTPYGGEQERTPVNREELVAKNNNYLSENARLSGGLA